MQSPVEENAANDLLDMAHERGMISAAELQTVRTEYLEGTKQGRSRSPVRIAIDRGVLSDRDLKDLETEAWIRRLPPDLGEYRLVRLIGRGGMAVVFEAQDVSLGKTVAIKLLLPEFAANHSYLSRFHREARIAAKLTHPNAVQVFRVGEKDAIEYLVMEYVEGQTMSSIIRKRGRIPEREALDIAFQLSGTLEEAAGLGIVHRDIKPSNVLLSKWGMPKLSDFGIAKQFDDGVDGQASQSLTLGIVGTPTYMSPEQARGAKNLDFRSDLYSLGATLYHMALGDLPFASATPQETLVRVASEAPAAPRTIMPELSEGAAAVICKMMAKIPADRYANYKDLKADLDAARNGRKVSLSYSKALRLLKPTTTQLVSRPEKKFSLGMIIGVAGGVVAVGGGVILLLTRGCS